MKEIANIDALVLGAPYSKKTAAEAMGVAPPRGPRHWGGIVSFSNAIAVFITLQKDQKRFAAEHQYHDRFDGSGLYWDSRASQGRGSNLLRRMMSPEVAVIGFSRLRERAGSATAKFHFIGRLKYESSWGERPVHFTWMVESYAELIDIRELHEMLNWTPESTPARKLKTASRLGGNTLDSKELLTEGAKTQAIVNRYERDPRARAACIEAHGCKCAVCRFDFGSVYGEVAQGFIFVHHRIPIARRSLGGEYELDPVRDLVPLCGNCHAVVHRRTDGSLEAKHLSEASFLLLKELRALAMADAWECF